MAEKPASKDASSATSSKLAGNPAFRMMGRSKVRTTGKPSRLIKKPYLQECRISNSGYRLAIGLFSGP